VGVDAVIEAEALGSEVNYPEDEPPSVVRPLLHGAKKTSEKLKDPADPRRSGRHAVVIDANMPDQGAPRDSVYIQSIVMGP